MYTFNIISYLSYTTKQFIISVQQILLERKRIQDNKIFQVNPHIVDTILLLQDAILIIGHITHSLLNGGRRISIKTQKQHQFEQDDAICTWCENLI